MQSALAVGLGALIGTLAPSVGEQLKLLGDVFLNLVQMVVLPLVFPLIVLGIAACPRAGRGAHPRHTDRPGLGIPPTGTPTPPGLGFGVRSPRRVPAPA
ncbi:cation:dicarboxylate symporter family transporter [Streptomyces venetus]|uniref:cation:dicarboxylate symporter family transporter n=1 Tax=Streptomyces venetus TaxID=1701086 RepID=UPI003C2B4267